MECTYCEAELNQEDTWWLGIPGKGEYQGEILRCPNHEGFESEEEAREYDDGTSEDGYIEDWEEIVCDSATHHVSGSFYTDKQGGLHEGYPC